MATNSFDKFLDFLVTKATPQEILGYELSEDENERAMELLELQDAEELTLEDQLELEQMRQVDQLVTLLKLRARAALDS